MKRIIFYFLRSFAFLCRLISNGLYMKLITLAHKSQGVRFAGRPEYIQQDAYLDPSGGLTVGEGVVISTRVIILTHDWSFLKRIKPGGVKNVDYQAYRSVVIGIESFIGAGAIILPGTTIGRNCIIGAGAVVKGNIADYSILVGNPAKVIGTTKS